MVKRLVAAAALCAVLCTATADAQTLGDAARAAEATRKASGANPLVFDSRDIDPLEAAHELIAYPVDDERWRRFVAADLWVVQALENDGALFSRLAALKITGPRVIERFCLREPALLEALRKAGSDPQEYAYTQMALLLASTLIAQAHPPEVVANMPATTRGNMAFVKAHEREMKEMNARAMQLKARMEQK
jgi:hypothetical protein